MTDTQEEAITSLNFYIHMKRKLQIERSKRSWSDLAILKEASSYLNFFKELDSVHPELVERCLEKVRFETAQKGEMLIKIGEEAETMYILLSGKIGIFRPRPEKEIMSELSIVRFLKNQFKITETNLEEVIDSLEHDSTYYRILRKYKKITSKHIVYRDSYLKKCLGGLTYKDIPNNADFFEQKKVLISVI